MLKNYYKILNLDFDAPLAEVKKAYRKLALLYHPDKTDNELLKARFEEIKEAYEVLRDPLRRKQYDLRFDNFSYKKEVQLTPWQLLQKLRAVRARTEKQDPHRMDRDRLEFEITELLSERNLHTLRHTVEKPLVKEFILELMETLRPLTMQQAGPLLQQVEPFADDSLRQQMRSFSESQTWSKRWDDYKIVVAIAAGILLCLLIYFFSK